MDLKMLTNVTQIIYMQSLADATIVQRWNGAENVFKISEQFIEHREYRGGGQQIQIQFCIKHKAVPALCNKC